MNPQQNNIPGDSSLHYNSQEYAQGVGRSPIPDSQGQQDSQGLERQQQDLVHLDEHLKAIRRRLDKLEQHFSNLSELPSILAAVRAANSAYELLYKQEKDRLDEQRKAMHSVVDEQKQKISTLLGGYEKGFKEIMKTIDNVANRIGLEYDEVAADDQDAIRETVPETQAGPSGEPSRPTGSPEMMNEQEFEQKLRTICEDNSDAVDPDVMEAIRNSDFTVPDKIKPPELKGKHLKYYDLYTNYVDLLGQGEKEPSFKKICQNVAEEKVTNYSKLKAAFDTLIKPLVQSTMADENGNRDRVSHRTNTDNIRPPSRYEKGRQPRVRSSTTAGEPTQGAAGKQVPEMGEKNRSTRKRSHAQFYAAAVDDRARKFLKKIENRKPRTNDKNQIGIGIFGSQNENPKERMEKAREKYFNEKEEEWIKKHMYIKFTSGNHLSAYLLDRCNKNCAKYLNKKLISWEEVQAILAQCCPHTDPFPKQQSRPGSGSRKLPNSPQINAIAQDEEDPRREEPVNAEERGYDTSERSGKNKDPLLEEIGRFQEKILEALDNEQTFSSTGKSGKQSATARISINDWENRNTLKTYQEITLCAKPPSRGVSQYIIGFIPMNKNDKAERYVYRERAIEILGDDAVRSLDRAKHTYYEELNKDCRCYMCLTGL